MKGDELKMPKALNLENQRFGNLVAISKTSSRSGKTYWLCQCDCGNQKEIQTGHLTSGATKSCGCNSKSIIDIDLNPQKKTCEICGKEFETIHLGWNRKYCYDCAPHEDENCSHSQAVTIKRRAIKRALIMRHGGKCERCGYDKCMRALDFHHLDPTQKDFGISKTLTKSFATLCEETDKCILLCSNCHAEEHQRLYEKGYTDFE